MMPPITNINQGGRVMLLVRGIGHRKVVNHVERTPVGINRPPGESDVADPMIATTPPYLTHSNTQSQLQNIRSKEALVWAVH